MKFLNALQPLALVVLRVAFGIIFLSHGWPTLAHRSSSVHTMFLQQGIPVYWVYISGVLEVFGGGLLAVGLFTRGAALLLAVEMVLMIWKVSPPHSYFAVNEYAYPMVVAAGCFVLATTGAGVISVDYPMFESRGGGKWKAAKNTKPGR
jgi:putative oxidoreductase